MMPGSKGSNVSEYLRGKPPEAVRLFRAFAKLVRSYGTSTPSVSRTVVYFKRNRVFAGAFIRSGRLEVAIDLRRKVTHPRLIAVFPTTKTVFTHRLRISRESELDPRLVKLICEAYQTVGPGTRA